MKKAFIGLGVLGIYLIYSLGIRHQQPQLPKPTSLTSSNTGSSSSAGKANLSTATTSAPATNSPQTSSSAYRDGTYTGASEDAYYGNVQVAVTVSGGKITNVKFLQYPNDRNTSVMINMQAMPYLTQEAIQAQSAQVDGVSGATQTSRAFIESLRSALSQAT